VLGGVRRGLSFVAMLTALYTALYVLLVSEDTALLLGSILVFALVAVALVTTRRVDWYSLRAPGSRYEGGGAASGKT
jgi:inner membrane protein